MEWHNRNLFIHPQDPRFDDSYDAEEDYENYVSACEDRYESNKVDYES